MTYPTFRRRHVRAHASVNGSPHSLKRGRPLAALVQQALVQIARVIAVRTCSGNGPLG